VTAVSGRRKALLSQLAAWGGDWPLADVQALYRRNGWTPADAEADLRLLVRSGDLAEAGQGTARTWHVNLAGLTGDA
jgi:hypothetical protein